MATEQRTARGGDGRGTRAELGIRDVEYDLISVVYHSLQGMEASATYALDAMEEGNAELAEFFRATGREQQARAAEARRLLAGRRA